MKQYWVVGGRYADTGFKEIAGGAEEECFGPFDTYEEAQGEWSRLAWTTVDDAHARYRLVKAEGPAPPDARERRRTAGRVRASGHRRPIRPLPIPVPTTLP
ncbi:MAG: DUF4170 domain-containing protein [Alphaproteobacteria bacterium]